MFRNVMKCCQNRVYKKQTQAGADASQFESGPVSGAGLAGLCHPQRLRVPQAAAGDPDWSFPSAHPPVNRLLQPEPQLGSTVWQLLAVATVFGGAERTGVLGGAEKVQDAGLVDD